MQSLYLLGLTTNEWLETIYECKSKKEKRSQQKLRALIEEGGHRRNLFYLLAGGCKDFIAAADV